MLRSVFAEKSDDEEKSSMQAVIEGPAHVMRRTNGRIIGRSYQCYARLTRLTMIPEISRADRDNLRKKYANAKSNFTVVVVRADDHRHLDIIS